MLKNAGDRTFTEMTKWLKRQHKTLTLLFLVCSLSQMTRVMIVLQFPPLQDRVEAAVTQKSSPHCERSTARWRTSPPATISLSSMGLPSKGIGYQTELLCKTISSKEAKGEGYLIILFAHAGLCLNWRGFVSEGTWGRRSDKSQRGPRCSESPRMP